MSRAKRIVRQFNKLSRNTPAQYADQFESNKRSNNADYPPQMNQLVMTN